MNADKVKHLEFIQSVITRMATNSFLIKGWMITLVSALFALAARDADGRYVMVTFVAVPLFWLLDAYYLAQERQYRDLYDEVRDATESMNFTLDASKHRAGSNRWPAAALAPVITILYLPVLVIGGLIVRWLAEKPG